MVHNNKVLTVSYGTFSCTLEGFEDSFGTMKAIAEYFRDLASDDRYFGAEPPQPDADMLARIAQREVARQVEARTSSDGIHLRTTAPVAAPLTSPAQPLVDQPAADAAPVVETPTAAPAPVADTPEAAPQPEETQPESAQPETKQPETEQPEVAVSAASSRPLTADSTAVETSEVELFDDLDASALQEQTDPEVDADTAAVEEAAIVPALDAPKDEEPEGADEAQAEPAPQDPVTKPAGLTPPSRVNLATIAAISAAVSAPSAEVDDTPEAEIIEDAPEADPEADPAQGAARGMDTVPAADSIAAKLQRIRAVVSQTPEEDFSEDEHAEAFVETARAELAQVEDEDFDELETDAESDEISRVLDRLELTGGRAAPAAEAEAAEDAPAAEDATAITDNTDSEALIASVLGETQIDLSDTTALSVQPETDLAQVGAAETEAPQVDAAQVDAAQADAELAKAELAETKPAEAKQTEAKEDQPRRPRRGIRLNHRPTTETDTTGAEATEAEAAKTDAPADVTASAQVEPEQSKPEQPEADQSEADQLAAAATAAPAPSKPVKARIVKIKRVVLEKAMASGNLQEITDEADGPVQTAPQPSAVVAPEQAPSIESSLDPDEEADLLRELAEVEAELLASNRDDEAEQDTDLEPATSAEEAPSKTTAHVQAAASPDSDVTRLMEAAESKLGEPDNATSRETYSHLRAAVAAAEADHAAGGTNATPDEAEPYRADLANVVRPRRPGAADAAKAPRPRSGGARPAPLKLVAEQRIDPVAPQPSKPVRPRRISAAAEAPARKTEAQGSFADYAQDLGAADLHELLEAAASYLSFVEGRDQFSRPQLMNTVRSVGHDDFNRENGLRSIGQLLREGKIERSDNGQFSATDDIGFRPSKRAAG